MQMGPNQTILHSKMLILTDHSILYTVQTNEMDFILKLKPNGSLDPAFANNGVLNLGVNNFLNVVLQGDKFIVYFGPKPTESNMYDDSKIVRYYGNGSVDTSFGNNGFLNEVTESTNPQALSVLVLADQSLIVTNSSDSYPKKFTIDGKLDSSFGNNGEIIYNYHFPIGQFSNGKIATCNINSLSSSIYSFYDLEDVADHTILNLDNLSCHQHNGINLQNKTNISTKNTHDGMVYSLFEYKNFPLPDFSRLVVIKAEQLDSHFNGHGFVTSEDYERYLDAGFANNIFLVLNQKYNQIKLNAFSATGSILTVNEVRNFDLLSGQEIEMKDNYILINSILPDDDQNLVRLKIEKYLIFNEKLSTETSLLKKIEVENPLKDYLNITNVENAERFEIYNIEGRLILASKNYKTINISNLLRGNYILKIKMKNGREISKKLIKN